MTDHPQNKQPPVPKQFLPSDPNKALEVVMHQIKTLQGVYDEETEALSSADIIAFLDLQDKKMNAARAYQHSIDEVLRRQEDLKKAGAKQRQNLKEMQKAFFETTKKNFDALQRMQKSTDRFGNRLRKAAKDAARDAQTISYNQQGYINGAENRPISAGSISESV